MPLKHTVSEHKLESSVYPDNIIDTKFNLDSISYEIMGIISKFSHVPVGFGSR
jgi:hypothetical protein